MSDIQEQQMQSINQLDVSDQMNTFIPKGKYVDELVEANQQDQVTEELEKPNAEGGADTVFEATNAKQPTNGVSCCQPSYKMEEENLILSYFTDAEHDVFRFRIEHNHAIRPLIGVTFKTPSGEDLVSLNELTIPLNRFLGMTECQNSPATHHVILVCNQNYVVENTSSQQIREAFIFLHKRRAEEDREDDATFCAVLSMLVIVIGILLAIGVCIRLGDDAFRRPSMV